MDSSSRITRVSFVAETLPHYRVDFHGTVQRLLAARGVQYTLYYGRDYRLAGRPGMTTSVDWGVELRNTYFKSAVGQLAWQHLPPRIWRSDLVVLGQENHLLVNYPLQGLRRFGPKIGLWGHGKNFQAETDDSRRERWKRFWSTQCDWWFAYTTLTRDVLIDNGFPADRITIFNNSTDTKTLKAEISAVSKEEIRAVREEIDCKSNEVAIFIGSIYPLKRMPFLIEAAKYVRDARPEFELIIVGGGEDTGWLDDVAKCHSWIHFLGPKFGHEQAELMSLAQLMVMPGHVGLAIVDGFAAGLPLITTAGPGHSPEYAYLTPGETGIAIEDWRDARAFADAMIGLFSDPDRLSRMSLAARRASEALSIEAMADNFVSGVLGALRAPRR